MKWQEVEIKKVVDVVSGYGFPREYQGTIDEEFPFFKVGDMNLPGNERCMSIMVNSISKETLKRLRARAFPKGTIVFPKIGAAIATNKKRMLIQPSVIDNNVMGFVPGQHINEWYLYYWMQQFDLRSVTNIGPVPSMRKTEVEKLLIPLPTLTEQGRIVEILDQADSLREKRSKADIKTALMLPALFNQIFGELATNSKGWDILEMDKVIESTRNGLYKPNDFYGHGISILKMFNIQDGELNLRRVDLIDVEEKEYKDYALKPGDILINRVNTPDLVGKCAVITEEVGKAVFESKNIRIRVKSDRAVSEYIASYLNSPFGHGSLRSGVKHAIGMATINNNDLRNLRVPLPPFHLQEKWRNIVRSSREIHKKSELCKIKIDILFDNLLHQAFTGDLTAKWRESRMSELLSEMEMQTKALNS